MALYERLLGRDDSGETYPEPRVSVHGFTAIMREFARGRLTGAQAQAGIAAISGAPLLPSESAEAQTLVGTITGNATAKLARASEIDDVLMLGEHQAPGYATPTEVRARLGV